VSTAAHFLEDVVELLERERRRVPMEAPWELTKAYAQLLIANGFARVGQSERGRGLAAEANAVLAPLCERKRVAGYRSRRDALGLHGYLVAVSHHRFEDACAYRPRTTRLPQALIAAHDALDRVAQYKVDRLAEVSPTIAVDGRTGSVDAIGTWMRGRAVQPARSILPAQHPLRELEPGIRAERIAIAFERPVRAAEHLGLLELFAELPAAAAEPVLASVVARAGAGDVRMQATACFIAVRYGYSELATPTFAALISKLESAPIDEELAAVVPLLLRAKHWLHVESDLGVLLERMWTALPNDDATLPTRLRVAAGLSAAAKDLRLSELFDNRLDASTTATLPDRLVRTKSLAAAATFTSATFGRELLGRLALRHWRTTTDSYGTNSHFCISVLQLVETLVLAHVDLTFANLNVLDPAQQAMLTSGFAL
jgi:hypothetical protein